MEIYTKTNELTPLWEEAFDHFLEIGFYEDSNDNGAQVKDFFHRIEQLPINVIPNIVIWRSDNCGCEENNLDPFNYYMFKWNNFTLLLYPNGTGDIGSSFGSSFGSVIHQFSSVDQIISHIEKNIEVYQLKI